MTSTSTRLERERVGLERVPPSRDVITKRIALVVSAVGGLRQWEGERPVIYIPVT
jgi:hypothetical protein